MNEFPLVTLHSSGWGNIWGNNITIKPRIRVSVQSLSPFTLHGPPYLVRLSEREGVAQG